MSKDIRTAPAVQSWPIDSIHEYENNAKVHTEEQVKKIAASIRQFGFDQPIVVDGAGVIIKGHGRKLAAQHLGMTHVPVIVRVDMTAREANASRLADNRVAEGSVDTEKLQSEIMEIAENADFDLSAMGFSDKEMNFLTADLGAMDDTVVVPDEELGSSRIAETDSDVEDLARDDMAIQKALGFSKIPGTAAPSIARFMTAIEASTGKQGAEAFAEFAESYAA